MRQGRSAKGWRGTKAVVRDCAAFVKSCVAVGRSSVARERSSASESGSCRSELSSVRDSDAFSHCCSASVMGVSSPSRFAEPVSKASATFLLRVSCSRAVARARRRRPGDMESWVEEDVDVAA